MYLQSFNAFIPNRKRSCVEQLHCVATTAAAAGLAVYGATHYGLTPGIKKTISDVALARFPALTASLYKLPISPQQFAAIFASVSVCVKAGILPFFGLTCGEFVGCHFDFLSQIGGKPLTFSLTHRIVEFVMTISLAHSVLEKNGASLNDNTFVVLGVGALLTTFAADVKRVAKKTLNEGPDFYLKVGIKAAVKGFVVYATTTTLNKIVSEVALGNIPEITALLAKLPPLTATYMGAFAAISTTVKDGVLPILGLNRDTIENRICEFVLTIPIAYTAFEKYGVPANHRPMSLILAGSFISTFFTK